MSRGTEWSARPMRSKYSRTGSRARRRPASTRGTGFTLLELIVTLALVGLLTGIVSVGLGRFGASAERSAAMRGVVGALAAARIEAMRTRSAHTVRVRVSVEGVAAETSGARAGRRAWVARGLRMVNETGRERSEVSAAFDSAGRTRERLWLVRERESGDSRDAAGGDGGGGGGVAGRIWRIEFDPVSGAPNLRAPGEEAGGSRRSR